MKRVILKNSNFSPHFIGSWNLESVELCDKLVNYFELNSSKQKKGITDSGINQNIKKSVDISIIPNEIKLPKNHLILKSTYISGINSIFIDDSYTERLDVKLHKNILCFSPSEIELLL